MKRKVFLLALLVILVMVVTGSVVAREAELTHPDYECVIGSCDVLITEVAWAGTVASPGQEWFEIFGNKSTPVYINNWDLVFWHPNGTKTKIDIPYTGYIQPNQFLVFEAWWDNTIVGRTANGVWYGPQIPNGNVTQMVLTKANGQIVHDVFFHSPWDWEEGNYTTKQTQEMMCYVMTGNSVEDVWQSSAIEGYYGYEDSAGNDLDGTPGGMTIYPGC